MRYVDLCWYGYHFDRATYDLLVDQVIGDSVPFTWAKGKVTTIADMYDIGRDLQKLRDGGSDNCNDVIAKLERELAVQRSELKTNIAAEISIVEELIDMMKACI